MRHVILPGASLMEIMPLADGFCVRCPGCGATQVYRGHGHRVFTHGDRCEVFARIERATEIYARDVVNRG